MDNILLIREDSFDRKEYQEAHETNQYYIGYEFKLLKSNMKGWRLATNEELEEYKKQIIIDELCAYAEKIDDILGTLKSLKEYCNRYINYENINDDLESIIKNIKEILENKN